MSCDWSQPGAAREQELHEARLQGERCTDGEGLGAVRRLWLGGGSNTWSDLGLRELPALPGD